MKANEMLNEIKTLLNIEVKLEEQKLENGTVVSAEAFEKGKEIFIVTDDEKIAMPVGEYILEDGRLVVVEEEGIIADVREVSDEVPAKEEEDGEEITEDLEEEVKEEMSYATKEELAEVKTMVEEIKAMLEPKEEMSEEVKEEIVEEVKEELSAVKPIKHNPEANTPQKKQVQFAKGNFNTTLDRVLSKLNK
eukprot:SAG31_NODE_3227_length_4519_cov_1.820588_4_plen_192_part_00